MYVSNRVEQYKNGAAKTIYTQYIYIGTHYAHIRWVKQ